MTEIDLKKAEEIVQGWLNKINIGDNPRAWPARLNHAQKTILVHDLASALSDERTKTQRNIFFRKPKC